MNRLVTACALIAVAMCAPAPEGQYIAAHGGGGYHLGPIGGYGGHFGRLGGFIGGPQGGHGVPIGGYPGYGGYGGQNFYAPAKYNFGYGVSDPYHGTNFGHSESRNGHRTEGEYFVDLPDGRRQKVTYYADETGYHPTVTYEGVAHYPPPRHAGPGRYH